MKLNPGLLYIVSKLMHGDHQIFMIPNHVFVFNMLTFKIFQKLNHKNMMKNIIYHWSKQP